MNGGRGGGVMKTTKIQQILSEGLGKAFLNRNFSRVFSEKKDASESALELSRKLIIVSTHYQSISNWLFPQRTILIE
jgi:hypothetical protein